MLEQLAYEVPRVSERQQVYQVGDLENLSAVALYYGNGGSPLGSLSNFGIVKTPSMKIEAPKVGTTLPGGLTVKKVGEESLTLQEDFGGVGNIYIAHPNGNGSTRFYGNKIVDGKEMGKYRETKTVWEKLRDGEPL